VFVAISWVKVVQALAVQREESHAFGSRLVHFRQNRSLPGFQRGGIHYSWLSPTAIKNYWQWKLAWTIKRAAGIRKMAPYIHSKRGGSHMHRPSAAGLDLPIYPVPRQRSCSACRKPSVAR